MADLSVETQLDYLKLKVRLQAKELKEFERQAFSKQRELRLSQENVRELESSLEENQEQLRQQQLELRLLQEKVATLESSLEEKQEQLQLNSFNHEDDDEGDADKLDSLTFLRMQRLQDENRWLREKLYATGSSHVVAELESLELLRKQASELTTKQELSVDGDGLQGLSSASSALTHSTSSHEHREGGSDLLWHGEETSADTLVFELENFRSCRMAGEDEAEQLTAALENAQLKLREHEAEV